ncbi:tetratricopeptide repeat protein [Robiginitalea sp. M366]|uniref:tetratricopeptide repeat protein n=1 Tax=Robiginitalea aestuariiviva TaxID=3036903 RepID=UPI00240D769A|nr:tetratricopeptide repeat protein [Robiginitalea aestuariiviva]MDG1571620.1 tetratricopeptide repeat protein [Robiginitalea aestuariiviva]
MNKHWFLISAFWILLAPCAAQVPADSLFARAAEAYNAGDYDDAIAHYQDILSQDLHSAALYFNLGNAYYKLGQIAPSIYHYEKALLLDPGDSEIRNNLEFARNMTLDDIQPLPRSDLHKAYDRVLYFFGMDVWAGIGIGFMFLFVLGAIFYYLLYLPNQKRISLIGALVALLLAGFASAMAYLNFRDYRQDQPAVIFSEAVTVHAEPNPRSEAVFELHEGTKVQMLDRLDNWVRLRIADGQTGWAPEDSMKALKDF